MSLIVCKFPGTSRRDTSFTTKVDAINPDLVHLAITNGTANARVGAYMTPAAARLVAANLLQEADKADAYDPEAAKRQQEIEKAQHAVKDAEKAYLTAKTRLRMAEGRSGLKERHSVYYVSVEIDGRYLWYETDADNAWTGTRVNIDGGVYAGRTGIVQSVEREKPAGIPYFHRVSAA